MRRHGSIESLMQMMNDPKIVFTLEPHG